MMSTKLLALTCVAVLAASSFAVHESFPAALGTAFRPISVERDSGSDSEDEESQVEGMLLDEAKEVEAMLLDEIDDEPRFPPLHVRIEKEAMSLVLNHIRPLDVQNQPISFLSTANLNCSKPASAHPNVKASAGNRRSRRRKEKSKATSPTQDDKPASTGNKHVSQRKLYWRRCIAPRAHRAGAGSN